MKGDRDDLYPFGYFLSAVCFHAVSIMNDFKKIVRNRTRYPRKANNRIAPANGAEMPNGDVRRGFADRRIVMSFAPSTLFSLVSFRRTFATYTPLMSTTSFFHRQNHPCSFSYACCSPPSLCYFPPPLAYAHHPLPLLAPNPHPAEQRA